MSFWMYSNRFPLSVKSLWSFSWSSQSFSGSAMCFFLVIFVFFYFFVRFFAIIFWGNIPWLLRRCFPKKSISKSTNLLAFYSFLAKALVCFNKFLSGKSAWFTHLPKWKKWKKNELKTLGSFSQFVIPKNYEAIPPTKLKTTTCLFTKKMKLIRETPNPTTPAFLSFRSGTTNSIDTHPTDRHVFFFRKRWSPSICRQREICWWWTPLPRLAPARYRSVSFICKGIPPRKLTCPSFGGAF